MKHSVVNRPAVKDDIEEAVDYYNEISPKLAHQFLDRLRETQKFIEENPLAVAVKYQKVRTVLLKQFPYHIHYLVQDEKREIVILAVIHSYRKPSDYSVR